MLALHSATEDLHRELHSSVDKHSTLLRAMERERVKGRIEHDSLKDHHGRLLTHHAKMSDTLTQVQTQVQWLRALRQASDKHTAANEHDRRRLARETARLEFDNHMLSRTVERVRARIDHVETKLQLAEVGGGGDGGWRVDGG